MEEEEEEEEEADGGGRDEAGKVKKKGTEKKKRNREGTQNRKKKTRGSDGAVDAGAARCVGGCGRRPATIVRSSDRRWFRRFLTAVG